jgi:hypothetical protein
MSKTSLLKAVRSQCLECVCYSSEEVKLCSSPNCSLYPYRFGKDPFRTKRVLTEEQKKVIADRFAKGKIAKEKAEALEKSLASPI